ncbi:HU family DNA-binding protein [Clostridium sp. AF32-12BH]|uniref:HU family DNA-binding protein n=1 Tax=Clostridium sp. AF32-12BH TaxID=2292006 RepID=UPI000E510F04|nr:HU family DNA-binding protein [Clostridium sp. AF32-12BH]RHP47045.1 HU family DNA-binding protein [Clostridium sp. AF32-12BH]
MKKVDLINCLVEDIKDTEFAEKLDGKSFSKKDATEIVEKVLDAMQAGLKKDGVLDVHGFFKMLVEDKPAREAKNPRTGEIVQVAAKKAIKCKFAKAIKDYVNE